MYSKLLPFSLAAVLMSGTAMAKAPNVAADIAPVHSLVARVMAGVGTPDLVFPAGASPHQYNLRPSEAGALQEADVVFWLGEDLTPWLADAVATLAEGASVTVTAMTTNTITTSMPARTGTIMITRIMTTTTSMTMTGTRLMRSTTTRSTTATTTTTTRMAGTIPTPGSRPATPRPGST